jgi:7-cyano-7-deazaguanine reductase
VSSAPSGTLKAVPNPAPHRDYEVRIETEEFTCVCPMTGQPDFATIVIVYVPDAWIVELKSLKLYLWSYRQEGIFHEAAANKILDDLVGTIQPKKIEVAADFSVRGGLHTTVRAAYKKEEKANSS